MTTLEVLKAARAKIEKPENWCRGKLKEYAGDTGPACKWCASGAVYDICPAGRAYWDSLDALANLVVDRSVSRFNDNPHTTHSDILALFDKAIAAEESKPQPPTNHD